MLGDTSAEVRQQRVAVRAGGERELLQLPALPGRQRQSLSVDRGLDRFVAGVEPSDEPPAGREGEQEMLAAGRGEREQLVDGGGIVGLRDAVVLAVGQSR